MKKFLLALLLVPTLAFAQKQPQGVTYDAQIVRVNDGDTVVIAAPFLPAPLKPELAVRIYGVDTPLPPLSIGLFGLIQPNAPSLYA